MLTEYVAICSLLIALFLILSFDDAINYQDYTVSVTDEIRRAEQRWKNKDSGKRKSSERNPSLCLFIHHKYRTEWPGTEHRSPRRKSFIISFHYMQQPFCAFSDIPRSQFWKSGLRKVTSGSTNIIQYTGFTFILSLDAV